MKVFIIKILVSNYEALGYLNRKIELISRTDPDLTVDAAHDMGVLSADFCKLYHTDRM